MIFAILLSPILAFAHIVQDDVSIQGKFRHSFKNVCIKMGHPDSPLVEVASGSTLDCMGRKIDIVEFCDKELAQDPYFIRAYIDQDKQEVICVTGTKVLFKYQCVKLTDKALCSKEAKFSCAYIQKKLARRLDMVHSSFTSNEKGIKQLNCYFDSLPLKEKHGI
jgi:hypothetical protein